MKKFIIALTLISISTMYCKKKAEPKPAEISRFAKYAVGVFENQDLKKAITYLSKGEMVFVTEESSANNDPAQATAKEKNKDKTSGKIVKVRLIDDKTGYMDEKHLSGEPLVITEESTNVFQRPSLDSRKMGTLPAGTIAFTESVKNNWIQIYVGKIDGQWIAGYWINSGYSTDKNLLVTAKDFEKAVQDFNDKKDGAEQTLHEIANGNPLFAPHVDRLLGTGVTHTEEDVIP